MIQSTLDLSGVYKNDKPDIQPETKAVGSYLFFDTETTGLPKNYKAPITDLDNWPRLVQLAWMSFDDDGNQVGEGSFIVRPEGFEIPAGAAAIHGISTDRALAEGLDLTEVLQKFMQAFDEAKYLVAHNMSYDIMIMQAEFLRTNLTVDLNPKEILCTKELTTEYCAIEGPYGYKWPKLSELHIKLFGVDFEDAHDALVDVRATAKCFWEMKKQGILKI